MSEKEAPFAVWLGILTMSGKKAGSFHEVKGEMECDDGPYVHVDQFMERVRRRMEDQNDCDECPYCWRDAARWVRHQIKEEKEL